MRETRLSGSEGGETDINSVFPTPIHMSVPVSIAHSGASYWVAWLLPQARGLAWGLIPSSPFGASTWVAWLFPQARGLAWGFTPSPPFGGFLPDAHNRWIKAPISTIPCEQPKVKNNR